MYIDNVKRCTIPKSKHILKTELSEHTNKAKSMFPSTLSNCPWEGQSRWHQSRVHSSASLFWPSKCRLHKGPSTLGKAQQGPTEDNNLSGLQKSDRSRVTHRSGIPGGHQKGNSRGNTWEQSPPSFSLRQLKGHLCCSCDRGGWPCKHQRPGERVKASVVS